MEEVGLLEPGSAPLSLRQQEDRVTENRSANPFISCSALHLGLVGFGCVWLGTQAHLSDLASFRYIDSASQVSFLSYVHTHSF